MTEPKYHLEGIVRTKTEEMEDFEGPLDVIFELLSKNKIEIKDVSITAILEQYTAYLDEMKRLDMEIASEFITMASHLMLIKTKMLLSEAERLEAESELESLRKSLAERERKDAMEQIRKAVVFLEPRNEIGRNTFTKQPEPLKRGLKTAIIVPFITMGLEHVLVAIKQTQRVVGKRMSAQIITKPLLPHFTLFILSILVAHITTA